jgi:predicted RNA-binding Zn-ribbon protein involved in translation (DUF1610 family)
MIECPKCGNKKIIEVGGKEIGYVRSVATGKILKKDKKGITIWWKYKCKCGWDSGNFVE